MKWLETRGRPHKPPFTSHFSPAPPKPLEAREKIKAPFELFSAASLRYDKTVNNEGSCRLPPNGFGTHRKISRRIKPFARWVLTCTLLLTPCVPVHAGWLKPDVNFSNYDAPLWAQITNRIKDKVAARLGQGVNTRDRYFIVPFAFQKRWNHAQFAHSFISVIRVLGDEKQPRLIPGLREGRFKNRDFEAFTISWAPHDFGTCPVCVFGGFGSRIFPTWNTCPIIVGRNFRLEETLKIALNEKGAVGVWGPYEIKKEAFDLGVKRKLFLDGGKIKYKADDRLTRKDLVAINCFHAMGNLEEPYPNGGFLGTGFKMWGIDGTARVLIEYTKAVQDKGLLLEPVDIKKDLYGFVYARERNSRAYNPFRNASAYHE